MKKSLIILISILALLVIIIGYGISINNKMVNADEAVMSQWAKVENQYQRRADLIPNLVNTVKGYASHEKETLDAVVNARAKATQVTISPDNLNEASLQKYQAAQGELSQALGRLLMVTENYPDLKANQNFLELQAQLEGTENRISTERTRYTDMVRDYNAMIRRFPASIIAGIGGFDKKPQFTAEAGAEKAPEVKF
ncbi:LemA family protein [Coprobacter fastidiosus]|uniref:LemA family protein n=1 Tax=Coprobacter fastidiosus TaxID=1099853 RepID=UPI001D40B038|nr:LemA family protein [Coprobacter fastidiosus]HJF43645.1 LemA family protein [Coprobacter fastidiosus]